jgi:hypothetical protein
MQNDLRFSFTKCNGCIKSLIFPRVVSRVRPSIVDSRTISTSRLPSRTLTTIAGPRRAHCIRQVNKNDTANVLQFRTCHSRNESSTLLMKWARGVCGCVSTHFSMCLYYRPIYRLMRISIHHFHLLLK